MSVDSTSAKAADGCETVIAESSTAAAAAYDASVATASPKSTMSVVSWRSILLAQPLASNGAPLVMETFLDDWARVVVDKMDESREDSDEACYERLKEWVTFRMSSEYTQDEKCRGYALALFRLKGTDKAVFLLVVPESLKVRVRMMISGAGTRIMPQVGANWTRVEEFPSTFEALAMLCEPRGLSFREAP
jgi:hypothetical protein